MSVQNVPDGERAPLFCTSAGKFWARVLHVPSGPHPRIQHHPCIPVSPCTPRFSAIRVPEPPCPSCASCEPRVPRALRFSGARPSAVLPGGPAEVRAVRVQNELRTHTAGPHSLRGFVYSLWGKKPHVSAKRTHSCPEFKHPRRWRRSRAPLVATVLRRSGPVGSPAAARPVR